MVTAEAQRDDQDEQYVRPDYDGACITNLVPALLEWPQPPSWLPAEAHRADQVAAGGAADGLGWCQLQEHGRPAAHAALAGRRPDHHRGAVHHRRRPHLDRHRPPPGEHGVVGYRVRLDDDVVNMLRWTSERGDARNAHPPSVVQPHEAFCGQRPAIVTRAEFSTTGFTQAHLAGARFHGYRVLSTLVAQVVELVRAGEPFVYAYYEGIDKVAHEYGLGDYYRAELHRRPPGGLAARGRSGPAGTGAGRSGPDYGQVETGDNVIAEPTSRCWPPPAVGEAACCGRIARRGKPALYESARLHHDAHAWVPHPR
ncbi:MAG: hypothetical protein R2755_16480 [Acidimicrobiales bacterium]